ncbi:MAG TPA: ricin-type beta-trefoil lectin domain protein [Streptosporangiaceae bacterium]|nr:ricin-type beta-trefoil lectin domain protein [Streptosporangiaceae bacterium]
MAAVAAVVAALGTSLPASATSARPVAPARTTAAHPAPAMVRGTTVHRAALPAGQQYVCPAAIKRGQMECNSIRSTRPAVPGKASAANANYGPAQLRSAYAIASAAAKKGKGVLVAIVDAFSDPNLAADLSRYRAHFHLPACTTKNGCLKIVNGAGKASPLPRPDKGWAIEESLDVDMVSAVCPNCHILLVEAKTNGTTDLGAAEKTAVAKGARFVSNSWSGPEFFGDDVSNADFNHPGDVINFAAGDAATGPAYPTDLQYVTAVGGTSLKHAKNKRGWSESAWGVNQTFAEGTAGGCSVQEPKPSWQRADASASAGCLNRTENDVSAVADPNTGVLIWDSYKVTPSGLQEIGGTSAATPIVTAIAALAGTPTKGSYPAEYPYLHTSHLFDVTTGVSGKCEPFRQYICHAKPGFDGPTGLGTPNGTAAFANTAHLVTLVDPGTQDASPSSPFSLKITGLDTAHATSLKWSATGLPSGLTIGAIAKSTNGRITGSLPGSPGTFHVTVTAKDGKVTGTTHFNIVTVPTLAAGSPGSGEVVITAANLCLDGGTNLNGQQVKVQNCSGQNFTITSGPAPNDVQTISVGSECLNVAAKSHNVTMADCNGAVAQQWQYLGFGFLFSPLTGGCLAPASAIAGAVVQAKTCNFNNANQEWSLPAGPITVGGDSLCLNNPSGTTISVATCNGAASEKFAFLTDGIVASNSGDCLTTDGSDLAQTAITLTTSCNDQDIFQIWVPGSFGEITAFNFSLCMAVKNNGGAGSAVVQNDCYGDPGENWGIN